MGAPLLKAKPVRITPRGVSDGIDGSNIFPGAMTSLANMIPAPHTANCWTARPASIAVSNFASYFSSPVAVECLKVVGAIAYGFMNSSNYVGKSVPFAFNLSTNTFQSISGITSTLLPSSASTTGDWEPPTCDVIGTRIIFTHPGFASGVNMIGWLDISGFSSLNVTGNTNGTVTISGLASNVLQDGWNIGNKISSSNGEIPSGAYIVSIASNGLSVVISAAATSSKTGSTFTVFGGSATAPQWCAGTTNGNSLIQRPVAVKNFNGRAWYAIGSSMQFSDALVPTQITNATQSLSVANGLPVTAFGGLPLTQTTGGILQALIAFQNDNGMVQITGDQATSNLALNSLGVGVGTNSPNTICATTRGMAFISGDGLRIVDFMGVVSEPLGDEGKGIQMAFLDAVYPTRMCAAFNGNVMRISVQNGYTPGSPYQEYWYDFMREIWSGPHSFPSNIIEAYQGGQGNQFVIAPIANPSQLFIGNVNPGTSDTFVENGSTMSFTFETMLTPDNEYVSTNAMMQSMVSCALETGQTITLTAYDEFGNTITTATLTGPTGNQTIWDSFYWGAANWSSTVVPFVQVQIPWKAPIVFKQMRLSITGQCYGGMFLGNMNFLVRKLGYTTQLVGT